MAGERGRGVDGRHDVGLLGLWFFAKDGKVANSGRTEGSAYRLIK
jgi:hypothetical protein